MKKIILIVISMILLLVTSCAEQADDGLAFIDESVDSAENAGSSDREPGSIRFSRDWESVAINQQFADGGERLYFSTYQFDPKEKIFILEADPVNMTYRPMCRKPGCTHTDESCHAFLKQTSNKEYCGWLIQGYDDGLYQQVIPKGDDSKDVMQLLKYDPLGNSPASVAYEIPLEGLNHATESYQVYPECRLHRGYAVITSKKEEEVNPDLQDGELSEDAASALEESDDYDPANPFNLMARSRYDCTMYVSMYDLEKGTMTPVLEKTYPNLSACFEQTYMVGDEIYILIVKLISRPITRTDAEGVSTYDIRHELSGMEIYRVALGGTLEPELIFDGTIPPALGSPGNVYFGNDEMRFLSRLDEDCEYGNLNDLVLVSLRLSNGKVKKENTLFKGTEDAMDNGADGYMTTAFFCDGYILARSYNEMPDFNASSYSGGERFMIFNLEGEKESEFAFHEELPGYQETYSMGASICGIGKDCIYCNNSTKDREVIYCVPLDGSEVRYFTPAEDSVAEASAETKDDEQDPEEKAVDYSDEIFSDLDPTTSTFGNLFAEDSEHLYVPVSYGPYAQNACLASVNKSTGKLQALCSKEGCTHDNAQCEADTGYFTSDRAMTVTDRELLVAGNLDQLSTIKIRGYDLETGTWSERGSIFKPEAGIEKMGYASENAGSFFHRDAFYYYTVRSKQVAGGVLGFKDTEITAVVYRYPLSGEGEGELILEQEISDADFCNMKVSACGDKLLITMMTGLYIAGAEENTVETTDNLFTVISYDIQDKTLETVYEGAESFYLMHLYPKQDALYMITATIGSTRVKKLDYETKTISDVGPAFEDTDCLVEFSQEGYFTIKKPSQYIETEDLSVSLFDFDGKPLREFSYKMPEKLLPENQGDYESQETEYLGADQWNLYFNDKYKNDKETVNQLYAVPLAGDAPVIFEW